MHAKRTSNDQCIMDCKEILGQISLLYKKLDEIKANTDTDQVSASFEYVNFVRDQLDKTASILLSQIYMNEQSSDEDVKQIKCNLCHIMQKGEDIKRQHQGTLLDHILEVDETIGAMYQERIEI